MTLLDYDISAPPLGGASFLLLIAMRRSAFVCIINDNIREVIAATTNWS